MSEAPAAPAPAPEARRVLSVLVRSAGERYAIPASDVLKVIEQGTLGRLPRLPRAILGITHHRGKIVTVFDLGVLLFGADGAPVSTGTQVVLFDRGHRNGGVQVDGIDEIVPVRVSQMRPGKVSALGVVQHRGAALNVLRTDLLLTAMDTAADDKPGANSGLERGGRS